LKQLSPQLENLCTFAHLLIMISGTNSILEVDTNSVEINYEKSTTEPNGPH
jgi:hypothetical protein